MYCEGKRADNAPSIGQESAEETEGSDTEENKRRLVLMLPK